LSKNVLFRKREKKRNSDNIRRGGGEQTSGKKANTRWSAGGKKDFEE